MNNGFDFNKFGDRNIEVKQGKIIGSINGKDYVRDFPYTYDSFIKEIKNIGYQSIYNGHYRDYINKSVEEHCMPPKAFCFHRFVYQFGRVPTFEEFFKYYSKLYCDKQSNIWIFKPKWHNGDFRFDYRWLKGNIWRSYYSFLREYDLLLYIQENLNDTARYSFYDDYVNGGDIVCDIDDSEIMIASYLRSKRSMKYKYIKDTIRHDNTLINACLDSQDDSQAWECNGVYLYKESYMCEVYKKCIELSRQQSC